MTTNTQTPAISGKETQMRMDEAFPVAVHHPIPAQRAVSITLTSAEWEMVACDMGIEHCMPNNVDATFRSLVTASIETQLRAKGVL